ncbi:MAG: D-alanyl-D-alanine carboxypeptidase [Cyclobacteriaceae bacterium]|nr:D-alanyl-D-alanine carboxypeptidase [Cyclobacteriaceae bacterium]
MRKEMNEVVGITNLLVKYFIATNYFFNSSFLIFERMLNRIHYQHIFKLSTFILLAFLSSCATTKFHIDKKPLEKHFETNSTFRESQTGLLVYDIEEKSTLFDYNAQKHFTPASNTKLLTWYAAIKMMGDSIPSLKFCVVNDSLYFTGTGDPTLLYSNFEYAKTFEFLRSSPHQLVYIDKRITDQRFGPGWSWDDYPYDYSAEKSSFPIYGNMVHFQKELTDGYIQVTPRYFEFGLTVKQDTSVSNYFIERKEMVNDFTLKFNGKSMPTFPASPAGGRQGREIDDALPFIYSSDLFINLLSDTLKRPVSQMNEFPDCIAELYYSVPTDSVIKHILIESDNFLAEHMLLIISSQLGDTLDSKKVIKSMMENHLSELKNQIYWVDGSGLSRYNQVTPNAMVSILEKMYNEIPKEKLFALLPESGKTGTLKTTFPQLEGKIHAKTGSMTHVYNISGYLETNSGKILLFSFMNNNFNVSFSELKKEMENVLAVFVNDKK